jgi:hypothetical protein
MSSSTTLPVASGAPSDNVDETDANMSVFNDHSNDIEFVVDNNTNMSSTFPSLTDIPPGRNATGYVQASDFPGQSSFVVHFDNNRSMQVQIGSSPYTTSVNPNFFSDLSGAAVLAPGKPLSDDTDYTFYFFNGSWIIPPLINSFINANLPAIIAYISNQPISINTSNQFVSNVTISQLELSPGALSCVSAGVSPTTGASNTTYTANLVFNITSGVIGGAMTVQGNNGPFDISVSNVFLYVQAQFDVSMATKPSITALQCSIGDYQASGGFIGLLESLPIVGPIIQAGATPYRVAGAINTDCNQDILQSVNNILGNIGAFATDGFFKLVAAHQAPTSTPKPAALATSADSAKTLHDNSTWMSTSQIQAKPLSQLKLPGTHDSATYGLTAELSQIQYGAIAFLWALSNQPAPVSGSWPIPKKPTPQNPWYLGDTLYNFVIGTAVKNIALTQPKPILKQLQDGIRYFDLRVYYDTRDGNFYTQHALKGPALGDVLNDVKSFIQTNPNSQELIFVEISHTNLASNTDQIPALTALINSYIPSGNLYWQATPQGQSQFYFQSLKDTVLSSITAGATKVMFLNTDTGYSYPDTVTNTAGFAGVPFQGEIYSLDNLQANQGPALQSHTEALWSVGWVLGISNNDIATNIIRWMRTAAPDPALGRIAVEVNGALQDFLNQYGTNFNVVMVDWEETSTGTRPAELIIGMNS